MQTISTTDETRVERALTVWMAWRRYLLTVRASSRERYELTEEAAWERLTSELASLGRPAPAPWS